jgi:hypothetical protein
MLEKTLRPQLIFILAFVFLSATISGCGKRGGAIPISDKEIYYPKIYPTH